MSDQRALDRIPVGWTKREPPLAPRVAVALGAVAQRLVERLLELDAARRERLRGVAGAELVAVEGDAADLPWVDGVIYCGVDPEAPGLRLPTTARPDIPLALFERAVRGRRGLETPIVVLPPSSAGPGRFFSLALARAPEPDDLLKWQGEDP